jgi:hypothetical protein
MCFESSSICHDFVELGCIVAPTHGAAGEILHGAHVVKLGILDQPYVRDRRRI